MPFEGSVPFPYNKDHSKLPTITLREAAQTERDILKCICKKGCKDKHCACRDAGFNCNSHCHPKSRSPVPIFSRIAQLFIRSEPFLQSMKGVYMCIYLHALQRQAELLPKISFLFFMLRRNIRKDASVL